MTGVCQSIYRESHSPCTPTSGRWMGSCRSHRRACQLRCCIPRTLGHDSNLFAKWENTLYIPVPTISTSIKIESLIDYIAKGDCERPGASSVGSVQCHCQDKDMTLKQIQRQGKYKGKNYFVLVIITPSGLNQECLSWPLHTENSGIISELAKIRFAVASPLPLYLLESSIIIWANSLYIKWRGSTLENGAKEDFKKNYYQWLQMRAGKSVLSYDFQTLNHQIVTIEILHTVDIGQSIATFNYRGNHKSTKLPI